jgi:acetoin utilization deacetylase AcuC-like enzyme
VGSKGTWTAAVCGVAAGLNIAEMVVHGKCINGFVISRPPGHHAGRNLHSMKAISNGFCILNTAACVAIYATTPLSEGGLGLSRACVIDFDVVSIVQPPVTCQQMNNRFVLTFFF